MNDESESEQNVRIADFYSHAIYKDTLRYQWRELENALKGCAYTAVTPLLIPILNTLTRWINKLGGNYD